MSLLPEGLVRTLASVDPSTPFVLFLRHAERAPLPSEDPYADVDLTPSGHEAALELGHRLGTRLSWAAISPFLRCRRTAEVLVARPGTSHVEVDTRLGSPGPWVMDRNEGARLFAELGTEGVVRAQLSGRHWPFIRAAGEGTRMLLSAALARLDAGRGSGVCVSHDSVLMPALAPLTGEQFTGAWLMPLDGFALQRSGGGLFCIWRGEHKEVASW
ncbi:MAG TPA: histidine phosphatase family protein [Archangium sp.]|nr:histidine phosphatase family protein [Archangium sp.]